MWGGGGGGLSKNSPRWAGETTAVTKIFQEHSLKRSAAVLPCKYLHEGEERPGRRFEPRQRSPRSRQDFRFRRGPGAVRGRRSPARCQLPGWSAAVRRPGEQKASAGPGGRWCQGEDLYCCHQSPRNLPAITFSYKADTKPAGGFKRWGQRRPAEALKKQTRNWWLLLRAMLFVHLLQLSLINQLIWQFPTFFCI